MSKQLKLLDAIKNDPGSVRLEDAVKVAESFGFVARSGGKHSVVMKKKGFRGGLNFQKLGKHVKPYQIKQLLNIIAELEASGE